MNRPTTLALATTVPALFFAQVASATCIQTTLEHQARRATIIFAGTVRSVAHTHAGGTPARRFCFDRIRVIKGQVSADSVILVQGGGIKGNREVLVTDEISFRQGGRYVVFAYQGYAEVPGSYSASGCDFADPFGIWPDSGAATPVVHTNRGEPIAAFDGAHAVVIRGAPWRADRAPRYRDAQRRLLPPTPPPRRALEDVLRSPDSSYEITYWPVPHGPSTDWVSGELVKWIWLYPHQDPGNRVSEQDFLHDLANMVSRLAAAPGDTSRAK